MKMQDVRKKSAADLKKMIKEAQNELREFRFAMAGAGKKNVRQARQLRKDIAQAKTVLNEGKNDA